MEVEPSKDPNGQWTTVACGPSADVSGRGGVGVKPQSSGSPAVTVSPNPRSPDEGTAFAINT
jgi:hypothetical protein